MVAQKLHIGARLFIPKPHDRPSASRQEIRRLFEPISLTNVISTSSMKGNGAGFYFTPRDILGLFNNFCLVSSPGGTAKASAVLNAQFEAYMMYKSRNKN